MKFKPNSLKQNAQQDCTMVMQGIKINTEAPLFTNLPIILFSLHLMYEELKLLSDYESHLKPLARLLNQLSYDLRLSKYTEHYWKDFPACCKMKMQFNDSQLTDSCLKKLTYPSYMMERPAEIFKQVYDILNLNRPLAFPFICGVNQISKILVQVSIIQHLN